jgi:hypothetical protein
MSVIIKGKNPRKPHTVRPGPCRIQSRTGRGFSALALAAAHDVPKTQ